MTALKDKIRRIKDILRIMYGQKTLKTAADPLDTLIGTILSQNTTDKNSVPAFKALKAKFGSWDKARRADLREIEKIIRRAGLFRQKAKRIKEALRKVHSAFGMTALYPLKKFEPEDSVLFLKGLKGVGPKTIACVMLFSLRKPYFPVDTHILRISKRLALIDEKTAAEDAHVFFAEAVPPGMMYELHINMIEHGRKTCHARNPECERCLLRRMCLWCKKNKI